MEMGLSKGLDQSGSTEKYWPREVYRDITTPILHAPGSRAAAAVGAPVSGNSLRR
jgi:hypothetical protein